MSFTQSSSLSKHQRVHDKLKPYSCTFEGCCKSFSQISNLIRHVKLHSGDRPFKCSECHKSFADKQNLKNHSNVHKPSGTRVKYSCLFCSKAFLYTSTLKKHVAQSHMQNQEALDQVSVKEILQSVEENVEAVSASKNPVPLGICDEILSHVEGNQYLDKEAVNALEFMINERPKLLQSEAPDVLDQIPDELETRLIFQDLVDEESDFN